MPTFFIGFQQSFHDDIATHDAAEDVHQNCLDVSIRQDDSKCLRHLINVRSTANVEEVSGFSTVKFDDVHGAHGQARTIDKATDWCRPG